MAFRDFSYLFNRFVAHEYAWRTRYRKYSPYLTENHYNEPSLRSYAISRENFGKKLIDHRRPHSKILVFFDHHCYSSTAVIRCKLANMARQTEALQAWIEVCFTLSHQHLPSSLSEVLTLLDLDIPAIIS